jgi:DNA polymerase elongation subunit (family B)
MNDTHLIFGKNDLSRVVGLEVNDDKAEVFTQDVSGTVSSTFVPNKFYILSDEQLSDKWFRLKGNNHYKWASIYSDRYDFLEAKKYWKYKKNKDVWCPHDPKESFMIRNGVTFFKEMKHTEPSILSFDLETNGLNKDKNSRIFLISNTFRNNGVITKKLFKYDDYRNDGEMLVDWSSWVRKVNPAIITGYNIVIYDLPFIQHVADLHEVSIDIGRDGSSLKFDDYQSKLRKDQTQFIYYNKPLVYGREVIDAYFYALKTDTIFKKWSSLSLKTVIKEEGLEKPGRTFYDAAQIRNNYKIPSEWKKIIEYAKDDSDDGLTLYDHLCPPYFYSTQSIPKSYQAVAESASGSQINSIMLRSYLQDGYSVPKGDDAVEFPGAISEGYPGLYRNVKKLDVQSLYPNIMLQYKINNLVKDPNNNLLNMLEYFTNERIKNKQLAKETGDEYYSHLEQTNKVFINSVFGFMGAPRLNFNDIKLAAKVTEIGRGILSTAMNWAKDKGFRLTSVDTDSIAFCKADQSPMDAEEQEQLRQELNTLYPERIRFMDDGYFQKSLVFAAKNYLNYDGKKIKTKGSALKSSTLESGFKEFLQTMASAILNDQTNYLEIYNKYVKRVCSITTKEEMKVFCSKKTISNTTLESERTNETKIVDAIADTEYVVGDKVWLYFKNDKSLGLVENFNGDYDRNVLLKKLYNTAFRFENIINCDIFLNYSLKKNQKSLEALLKENK